MILIYPDLAALSAAAAQQFVAAACQAISQQGRYTVALSGGSTPRALFTLLASKPYSQQIAWTQTHVFWGDERCVPPDHPDSNYRLANETLLSQVPLPQENVHRMPAELEPEQAATQYEQQLQQFFHLPAGAFPCFDLVLLGMGADGHTASLFPHTSGLHQRTRLVVANYVPKLSTFRLTLTTPALNHAARIMFLVAGQDKAATLKEVLYGPRQPEQLPAQIIAPVKGQLVWLIDQAVSGCTSGASANGGPLV
ncbi:MAG: 6-phosphogluconolactonase [Deinococcus sp.]|nr:6-phosphogluconolactonase [Deinococcus sp.]